MYIHNCIGNVSTVELGVTNDGAVQNKKRKTSSASGRSCKLTVVTIINMYIHTYVHILYHTHVLMYHVYILLFYPITYNTKALVIAL